MIITIASTLAIGNKIGDSTHNHDQLITPVSLRPIKSIARRLMK